MIDIISGSTNKAPVTSELLANIATKLGDINGTLYLGYPIIGTPEGPFSLDALLITEQHGLVLIDLIEGNDLGNFRERQDQAFSKVKAKLLQHNSLVKGRTIDVPLLTLTFSPTTRNLEVDLESEYGLANDEESLVSFLENNVVDFTKYEETLSVIQAVSTIRRGRKRNIENPNSRGAKVKLLEDSIANLDASQSAAVIETYDGVQRIRGLAGSGKTIVLALKVAYLHAQNPDWKIAITFNTRALKKQFERLVNNFVLEQTNEEADWDVIDIINAWGAPGNKYREGIYYNYCMDNSLNYYDFGSAKSKFGAQNAFRKVCELALSESGNISEKYDLILIDEAQDFDPPFFKICYNLLKEPKRLVYAYDELQCLNGNEMPSPEELFGVNEEGTPLVSFVDVNERIKARQDVILEKCYRNPRPLLATAHALGFGIYEENNNIVQMFDNPHLWLDIGYSIADGKLESGERVTLERTNETSPLFLENHSPIDDLINFMAFNHPSEQDDWVVNSILDDIHNNELRPEDILLINANPLKTRMQVSNIRKILLENGINSEIAGVSTSPDVFVNEGNVTCTGIYRAKGNEAPMVYIINADYCQTDYFNRDVKRNILFTAITRSKAWVRVVGVGERMEKLNLEFEKVKKNNFRLEFEYPTEEQRSNMKIVNRESAAKRNKVDEKKKQLSLLLEELSKDEENKNEYIKEIEKHFKNG